MFGLGLSLLCLCLPSYVNHSCAPNCVAEVVTFDKEDKIIIISSRRIPKGEEVGSSYIFHLAVLSVLFPSYNPLYSPLYLF